MKKEIVTYKSGSFTDFAGLEHKFVVCALSTSVYGDGNAILVTLDKVGDEISECQLPRAVFIGIAVCNPGDKWDEEKGKMIAYNKAKGFKACKPEKSAAIFATRAGLISDALVEAILTKEIQHIIDDPESVIPGYNQMKSRYESDKELKELMDRIPENLKELGRQLSGLSIGELDQVFVVAAQNEQ